MADLNRVVQRAKGLLAKGEALREQAEEDEHREEYVLDAPALSAWFVQVSRFLATFLDDDDPYSEAFAQVPKSNWAPNLDEALALLRAVADDLDEGWLTSLRARVTAELVSDYLDLAEQLLDAGDKDPAAMLVGAVLEAELERIGRDSGADVAAKETLATISDKLLKAQLINKLERKDLAAWTGVRDHAAHGEFDEYDHEAVRRMLSGVTSFLAKHAT